MRNNIWLFVASLLVPSSTWILARKSEESAVVMLMFLGILGVVFVYHAFKSITDQKRPILGGTIFSITLLPWVIALSAPEISVTSFITMWIQPVSIYHSWYISYLITGACINIVIFFLGGVVFVVLRNKNRVGLISPKLATMTIVAFYILTIFITAQFFES
jgi:hypothetical protein